MYGLENEKTSNNLYFSIIGGRIAQRVTEHIKDAKGKLITENREIKDDDGRVIKTVIERYYSGIGGLLQEAKLDNGDYGTQIKLSFMPTDNEGNPKGDNLLVFSFPFETNYGKSFLFRMNNIDIDKPFILRPYNFESKTEMNKQGKPKKIVGITIIQSSMGYENDKVPPFWTKDSQGDLPELDVKVVAGKNKYNDDNRMAYLSDEFVKWADKLSDFGNETQQSSLEKSAEYVAGVMGASVEFAKSKHDDTYHSDNDDDDDDDDLLF